jgi:hypothetical protein
VRKARVFHTATSMAAGHGDFDADRGFSFGLDGVGGPLVSF